MRHAAFLTATAIAAILAAAPVSGLEKNEKQLNFMFDTALPTVPGHATSIIIARSPEKAFPFIIVGRPVTGELVLVSPDDGDLANLVLSDQVAAELMDLDGLAGSCVVNFYAYSGGYPPQHQLGIEQWERGRPTWLLRIDNISDFIILPQSEREAKQDKEKKDKKSTSGGEKTYYSGTLNGSLQIADNVRIPLKHPVAIVVTAASSRLVTSERAEPTMEFINSTIAFAFDLKVPGKDIGWEVSEVSMDINFYGYADTKKGSDELFEKNLPRVRMGRP